MKRPVPPQIDGFVWWTNRVRDHRNRLIPLTDIGRQFCAFESAESLGVPLEAVRVEKFTPNDGYDCEQWAVYINVEYADVVRERVRDLMDTLRTVEQFARLSGW